MAHEATAPTPGSKAQTRQDARSRGWRTALQGAVSTVLVAVAAVVTDQVVPGEIIDWPTLGVAVRPPPVPRWPLGFSVALRVARTQTDA